MEGSPKWSKKINGHRPYSYITLSRAYLTKTNWQGKRVKRVVGRAVKSSKLRNKLSLTTKELSTVTECVSALHTLFFLWIFLWFSRLPIVLRLFNKEIKYHQRLVTACQSILEVTRLGIFAALTGNCRRSRMKPVIRQGSVTSDVVSLVESEQQKGIRIDLWTQSSQK